MKEDLEDQGIIFTDTDSALERKRRTVQENISVQLFRTPTTNSLL